MKKTIIILLSVGLILGAAFYIVRRKNASSRKAFEIRVSHGDIISMIRINGNVEPRNRVIIKPQIAGRIEDILVVEGQKVKKGEIVAWISSLERSALLDIAKSQGEEEYKKWQEVYRPAPIIAPLDGFIIVRDKEPGQTVTANDSVLVMADELIIKAYVDETDLRYVKLGQMVEISLDAYPDIKFGGIIEHISYESKQLNNVTVYEVKIKPRPKKIDMQKKTFGIGGHELTGRKHFPREGTGQIPLLPPQEQRKREINKYPEQRDLSSILRSGMSATIEIIYEERRNVLTLPISAIVDSGKEKYVFVKKGNKLVKQPVETGLSDGKNIEIVSGVSEGDIVIVSQERAYRGLPPTAGIGATQQRPPNPMLSFFRR
jgi:macrolide-specific efflux system membrane fusion protein